MSLNISLDEIREVLKAEREFPFNNDQELIQGIKNHILSFYWIGKSYADLVPPETELEKRVRAHVAACSIVESGLTYTELGVSGYMGVLPDVLILEHIAITQWVAEISENVTRARIRRG